MWWLFVDGTGYEDGQLVSVVGFQTVSCTGGET